jgi:hypothetical protein
MAGLYETQMTSLDSAVPSKWLNAYGELDIAAVTKEAHRLRGEAMGELFTSLRQSVKGMLHIGGHAAHS